MNGWLIVRKHKIFRTMMWFLLAGWLAMGADMYAGSNAGVSWQNAEVSSAKHAAVALNEAGDGFSARVDGRELAFFCVQDAPFCRFLENRRSTGDSGKVLEADLEYLAADAGNVLLSVSFVDGRTDERVVQRYPKALVDAQAERVERQSAGWWRGVPVYLKHIFFTLFSLLLLIRLYVWVVETRLRRRVPAE